MNVDETDGTVTEQPADDIRSALTAAVAEAETPETPVVDTTPKPDAGTDTSAADGRVRGPDGKFAKKEETEPVAAVPDKAADPVAAQPDTAVSAPEGWKAADKEAFKTLPPAIQKVISDNSRAQLADYTRKTQDIAAFKKEYGPVDEMFAPHKDVLRQKGFTPRSLIESWANVETKLAAGPDSAIEVIKGLLSGYGIPVERLAGALGLSKGQAQGQPGQQPVAVENGQQVALPPAVEAELKALREQVGTFGQKFQTIEQREADARRAREIADENHANDTIQKFKSTTDEKGSLLYPHFDEVEKMMNDLAAVALTNKGQPVPSLKELYETAVYATPSTREKVRTAQEQQAEQKRTEEARNKAAAARKAGSSVQGAPGSGQAPGAKSSSDVPLRDSLEAAYDEVAG